MPDSDFVVLEEAATAFHAELIAGALKNAGIEARTDGGQPTDEFQVARRLMGQGVRIFVPADRLEEAQALVAEIRKAGA